MRAGYLWTPALILAADVLPVGVAPDSTGKYRLFLSYGAAEYEYQAFSCDGTLVEAAPVRLRSGGARVEVWTCPTARLTAFGGQIEYDERPPNADDYGGGFGGFLAAWEGRVIGLGGGGVATSGEDGFLAPAIYFRAGSIDQLHGRLEIFPASEALGVTGWFRVGLAYDQGLRRGPRFFTGLSFAPYTYGDDAEPRIFGEIDVPLHSRGGLVLRGHGGSSPDGWMWGGAGGLWFDFGSVPGRRER